MSGINAGIAEVEKQIRQVEEQVQQAAENAANAADKEDRDYWREKEKDPREKEDLREKEKDLLKEKMLLLEHKDLEKQIRQVEEQVQHAAENTANAADLEVVWEHMVQMISMTTQSLGSTGVVPEPQQEDPAVVQNIQIEKSKGFEVDLAKGTEELSRVLLEKTMNGVDTAKLVNGMDTAMDGMMQDVMMELEQRQSMQQPSGSDESNLHRIHSMWLLGREPQVTHLIPRGGKDIRDWVINNAVAHHNEEAKAAFANPAGTLLIYQVNTRKHIDFNSYSSAVDFLASWLEMLCGPGRRRRRGIDLLGSR